MGFLQKLRATAKEILPSRDKWWFFGRNIGAARNQPSFAQRYGVALAKVEQLTGLPAAELILKFESLGDNCEFGLVQRRCGAEPLGLLRLSYIEPGHLMRMLDCDFAELGASQDMELIQSGNPDREYLVRDRKYELFFHSLHYEANGIDDAVVARLGARFAFLGRKLQEDLAAGEKILVLKRNLPLNDEEIGTMHRLLQRHGRNTLLAVVPADQSRVPGTVEQVRPGLFKAYIDRFAPHENAEDLSFEVWLNICVQAYLLNQRRLESPL